MLEEISEEIKTSERPVVKNLFSDAGVKLIAIGLKKGVELKEHTAPSKAKLVMVKGEIDFLIGDERHRFKVQDHFDIPLQEKHAVIGVEDAVFLLVLS